MRAILIAFLICAGAVHADDAKTRRMLEIIQTRLEPAHRDRVLALWEQTRERPEVRLRLAQALEGFDQKMKPDWTGLSIAGGTTALAAGIGTGWLLAAKFGAAGSVAGPVGVVAGVAAGALIGYSIHRYHQRKALSGGVFSRAGRRMGFKGKGLEGDLLKIEDELRRPAPAAPPAAGAPTPRRRWYDRFRRTPASPAPAPAAAAPEAPARRDDPNADDVHHPLDR